MSDTNPFGSLGGEDLAGVARVLSRAGDHQQHQARANAG